MHSNTWWYVHKHSRKKQKIYDQNTTHIHFHIRIAMRIHQKQPKNNHIYIYDFESLLVRLQIPNKFSWVEVMRNDCHINVDDIILEQENERTFHIYCLLSFFPSYTHSDLVLDCFSNGRASVAMVIKCIHKIPSNK